MRFTAIDFETANSNRGSICAVGLVTVENGKVESITSEFIQPVPLVFHQRNVRLHGISSCDVRDARTFARAWRSLRDRIQGPLVAHNAAFDMSAMRLALDQAGIRHPQLEFLCTLTMSKRLDPHFPRHRLDYVARKRGIVFQHHNAADDARACALVALSAASQVGASSIPELADKCGLRVGRVSPDGYVSCCVVDKRGVSPLPYPATQSVKSGLRKASAAFPIGTTFAFTGELDSMTRGDAERAVKCRGGICHQHVKQDTSVLVIGDGGYVAYGVGHRSSKVKRAEKLKANGHPISVVSEAEFLSMLAESLGSGEL
nr:exonuclease domain-containing protein [Nitrosomonas nitrosa]